MALNPVTVAATKRTLQRVATRHGLPIAAEDVEAVAQAAGGDLRSAIGSLQLLLMGRRAMPARSRGRARPKPLGLGAEGKSLFGKVRGGFWIMVHHRRLLPRTIRCPFSIPLGRFSTTSEPSRKASPKRQIRCTRKASPEGPPSHQCNAPRPCSHPRRCCNRQHCPQHLRLHFFMSTTLALLRTTASTRLLVPLPT